MKIYTRGGDTGETSLLGPDRVRKNDARIEAYGTVDELNSLIGVARASWPGSPLEPQLAAIQSDLFDVGAFLAASGRGFTTVSRHRIEALEHGIDAMEEELKPLRSFILPGGAPAAAQLHLARTVCRRAERRVVALDRDDDEFRVSVAYLNRLSDFLFVAARFANHKLGVEDVPWHGKR
ncbi:MAG TPA: cob(I)yrinic acid a,c-diamide adenosyltransferase [Thermoanaerobaculia bacterium]